MYLTDQQLSASSDLGENSIIIPPSQPFYYPRAVTPNLGLAPYGFGKAPALSAPRGLVLLDHFHFPKQPDTSKPGQFITGPIAKLAVSNMNPGFIDASDNLIVDNSSTGLQTCLHALITTQFQNYLSSKSSTAPASGDRLRVALVDLTGDKIAQPEFAGWGSTAAMYAASSAKVLAIYAAHQLRMDLRTLATSQNIRDGSLLEKTALQTWRLSGAPDLQWLFKIRDWSGNPDTLNFTLQAREVFREIMHNEQAGTLIIKVGFPYIASVTWQSGLFHPKRGGLWLSSSYGKGSWAKNPISGVFSANITALSAATYFTLLAQGRLVDDVSSSEIKTWLRGGCITGLFPDSLGVVTSKCGIWSNYLHDCALIARGGIRYVVVGLTRTNRNEYSNYTQLYLELDTLIVRNNQTPKLTC
jgi:hypothetical protein